MSVAAAWVTLPIAYAVLSAGVLFVTAAQDDYGVPCKEAFDYMPARIPEGATDLRCRSHGLMDQTFQVTFRMPQADLDAWVAESFPDRRPPNENPFLLGPCEVDFCAGVMRDRLDPAIVGAADIALSADHSDDGTTVVHIDAGE
ncbi:hypothetical protein [Streptomyces sp. NPDC085540]|uniref:hypothetical protein n=1 Tax=Streptomyces sp. NPDC085540 TaxID=3365730 RepID=UPI0037D0AD6D